MSKIGKKPINIPEGVEVEMKNGCVKISKNGKELQVPSLKGVDVKIEDGIIFFLLEEDTKQARSNWGTFRSLVQNAIQGVTKGFQKTLLLEGVGYRIQKQGNTLVLSLGHSHDIEYEEPEDITLEVESKTKLVIKGIDKAKVGQVAAEIRSFRPVEPYKGKGIRYKDEVVRRKVGKKAVSSSEI